MQPSEIEQMPYYELEYTLQNLKDFLEKKKEGEKEQQDEYKSSSMSKDMMRQQSEMGRSINTSKISSSPSYKMPSGSGFNLPKKF